MSTKAPLSWFRVELDCTGKVISCTIVAEPAEGTNSLFFFKAATSEKASRLAYNAHSAALLKARRAQYRAEGRCRCGRAREGERSRCAICIEKSILDQRRVALRKRGVEVPTPDRREALSARKDEDRDTIRLDTLQQINRRFLALPKGDFLRWLQGEMEKISGKRVA